MNFFPRFKVKVKVTGESKFVKYGLTPNLQVPTWSMEASGVFDTMSPRDRPQDVTKAVSSNSSQGLGHVTPNLGYLAKSAKCENIFSDMDGITLTQIQGQCHGTLKFSKCGFTQNRWVST